MPPAELLAALLSASPVIIAAATMPVLVPEPRSMRPTRIGLSETLCCNDRQDQAGC